MRWRILCGRQRWSWDPRQPNNRLTASRSNWVKRICIFLEPELKNEKDTLKYTYKDVLFLDISINWKMLCIDEKKITCKLTMVDIWSIAWQIQPFTVTANKKRIIDTKACDEKLLPAVMQRGKLLPCSLSLPINVALNVSFLQLIGLWRKI